MPVAGPWWTRGDEQRRRVGSWTPVSPRVPDPGLRPNGGGGAVAADGRGRCRPRRPLDPPAVPGGSTTPADRAPGGHVPAMVVAVAADGGGRSRSGRPGPEPVCRPPRPRVFRHRHSPDGNVGDVGLWPRHRLPRLRERANGGAGSDGRRPLLGGDRRVARPTRGSSRPLHHRHVHGHHGCAGDNGRRTRHRAPPDDAAPQPAATCPRRRCRRAHAGGDGRLRGPGGERCGSGRSGAVDHAPR